MQGSVKLKDGKGMCVLLVEGATEPRGKVLYQNKKRSPQTP